MMGEQANSFLLDSLNQSVIENNNENIKSILDTIIHDAKEFNLDVYEALTILLKYEDNEIKILTVKTIAELSKGMEQRKNLTQKTLLIELLDFLKANVDDKNINLIIQTCRALGNICYENNEGRNILTDLNTLEKLIKLLEVTVVENNDEFHQFRVVSCGFLLNYLMGNDDLLINSLAFDIFNKLYLVLDVEIHNLNKNDDAITYLLLILGLFSDTVSDCWYSAELNKVLVKILKLSENPEISEMCLELLHAQAENDEIKLSLAKCGLCETLHGLLEAYSSLAADPTARALVKLACDVIVLVLTGDESMHYLYAGNNLIHAMIGWLDSSDPDLLVTGVLALGNFARTDEHCIDMVETGIMIKLLDILSQNNSTDDDIRLQHALLSALRNIAIPRKNKSAVVHAGLVQTILPMLGIHQPPVVFKLLGTLRMVVDGQENTANELLQNENLLSQLVHWCQQTEHPGVAGESPRLMAWLIKHCRSTDRNNAEETSSGDNSSFEKEEDTARKSLLSLLKVEGTVSSVASMLLSSHAVMQNEALIALTILAATFFGNDAQETDDLNVAIVFIEADIGDKLNKFLTVSKDLNIEIIDNVLVFIKFLIKSHTVNNHLSQNDCKKSVEKLLERYDLDSRIDSINYVLNELK